MLEAVAVPRLPLLEIVMNLTTLLHGAHLES